MVFGVAERGEAKPNARPLRLGEGTRKRGVDVARRCDGRLEVDVISAYDSRKNRSPRRRTWPGAGTPSARVVMIVNRR